MQYIKQLEKTESRFTIARDRNEKWRKIIQDIYCNGNTGFKFSGQWKG